jgi:hypothetical protein
MAAGIAVTVRYSPLRLATIGIGRAVAQAVYLFAIEGDEFERHIAVLMIAGIQAYGNDACKHSESCRRTM